MTVLRAVGPGDKTPASDPLADLAKAAAAVHDMFTAYMGAGFSREEALYLVAVVASGGVKAPPPNPQPPS